MLVKELKKILKNIPDDMEICLDLSDHQGDCDRVGLSILQDDGMYEFIETGEKADIDEEINFLIAGS